MLGRAEKRHLYITGNERKINMSYGSYPYYRPGYYPQTADNSQYGQPYQPNQMLQNLQQPPIQSNGGLIWVDNEEQAKNYLVAPNNVVPMFDKSKSAMYIKSADGAGMPTFKKYKLVDMNEEIPTTQTEEHKCTCGGKFVGKEEFESFKEKFYELQMKCDDIIQEKPKSKTSKSKGSEE